jgi:hypothetical protein
MAANSNALIFWIAVVVALGGLVLRWWPLVVIAGFVVYLFSGDGWGRIKKKP